MTVFDASLANLLPEGWSFSFLMAWFPIRKQFCFGLEFMMTSPAFHVSFCRGHDIPICFDLGELWLVPYMNGFGPDSVFNFLLGVLSLKARH